MGSPPCPAGFDGRTQLGQQHPGGCRISKAQEDPREDDPAGNAEEVKAEGVSGGS